MATTPVNLYRSVRKEDFRNGVTIDGAPAPGVLFPDFYKKELPSGDIRDPDVDMVKDDKDVEWVLPGGGTSLFDVRGVFKGRSWLIFDILSGTEIPDSLIVRKTHYSKKFSATHYQIEVKADMMRKDAFQGALDNLARNAIVRSLASTKTTTV